MMTTAGISSWPARLLAAACAFSFPVAGLHAQSTPEPDPAQAEVPLPCAPGWQARLVFDAGVGVWTVASAQVQPQFGCPEIFALDDRGRCTVLRSYSGKWTPQPTIEDGQWFAPVATGDLDPTLEGLEIYTGGQGGRLWQIRPRPSAHFDCRVIGEWPGEEIHTLVLDDLDAEHAGAELLVFLASGRVHVVRSEGGGVAATELPRLPGRVRQAVVLPAAAGAAPWLATVSRTGHLDLVQLRGDRLERHTIAQEPMGLGRVAVAGAPGGATVLYVTRDDGLILRFAGRPGPGSGLERQVVYAGPQGPRGIVTGAFHEDPRRECVAIFGYSAKVELLTRLPGQPWQSETIFTDVDKGHWLAVAELDGRNGTAELIGSGYGGRVFLLSRPPGYGLRDESIAVSTEVAPMPADDDAAPLRLGLRARAGGAEKLTPLRYTGGFEPKTMLYETLVRCGDDGRIVPGLAASWAFEDDGRAVRFELREGARFHDGTPVTAEAVQEHFRRWFGLPEHDWLPSNRRITGVTVESERVLRVQMDRPWALLPDLCAINPCAILGPGARDREGEFVRPVGTGPFRFVEELDDRSWRVARFGAGEETLLDVTVFPRGGNDEPIDALLRGGIDAFVGGWDEDLPADRLRELKRDPGFRVVDAPGSSVVSLQFRLEEGPTADLELRRRIAAAVSRAELIRRAEGGFADPCTAWAAPSVKTWPAVADRGADGGGFDEATANGETNGAAPLRIAAGRSDRTARVARIVAEQLRRAGIDADVVEDRDADVAVTASHGVPYDPHSTLVTRFGSSGDAELRALVQKAAATPGEAERLPIYARIQEILDREVLMVPLYAPRRIALHTAQVEGIRLGIDVYHVDVTGLRRVR